MKVLIISDFGKGLVTDRNAIPRIGDKIDVFFTPMPVVKDVIWWPSKKL